MDESPSIWGVRGIEYQNWRWTGDMVTHHMTLEARQVCKRTLAQWTITHNLLNLPLLHALVRNTYSSLSCILNVLGCTHLVTERAHALWTLICGYRHCHRDEGPMLSTFGTPLMAAKCCTLIKDTSTLSSVVVQKGAHVLFQT